MPILIPTYTFRLRHNGSFKQIYDPVRRKFVAFTPEEGVRQTILKWMIEELKYPATRISVESQHKYNNRLKRSDVVVYNSEGRAALLLECKAPEVPITQAVFRQAINYNEVIKANHLAVSNGYQLICLGYDPDAKTWREHDAMPLM